MPPTIPRQTDIFYWLNRQPISSAATASPPFPSAVEFEGPAISIGSKNANRPQQTRLKYWVEHQSAKPLSPAFSFLDFPREIRDEIYNHLYPFNPPPFRDEVDITTELGKEGKWRWLYDWPSVSFLLTCRTAYTEAIPLYYGRQRFRFELPTSSERAMVYEWIQLHSPLVWLNKIGSRNWAYIRHISVKSETDHNVDTDYRIETGYAIHLQGGSGGVNLFWLATELASQLIKRLPCLESLSLEFRGWDSPFHPPIVVLNAIETILKLKYFFASVMLHGLAKDSPIVEMLKRRPALRNPCFKGIMEGRITASYMNGPGSLELYDGVAYSMPREQRVSKFWHDVAPMQELEIRDNSSAEQITPLEMRAIQASQQASLENLVLFISTDGISPELAKALKECVRNMEKLTSFTLLPRLAGEHRDDRTLPWHVDSSLLTCLPPRMEDLLLALRVSNRSLCESHCATLVFRCRRLKYFRYAHCNTFGFLGDRAPLRLSMQRLVRAGVDVRLHDSDYHTSYAKELPESGTWCY